MSVRRDAPLDSSKADDHLKLVPEEIPLQTIEADTAKIEPGTEIEPGTDIEPGKEIEPGTEIELGTEIETGMNEGPSTDLDRASAIDQLPTDTGTPDKEKEAGVSESGRNVDEQTEGVIEKSSV